jgi:hypothetical protein
MMAPKCSKCDGTRWIRYLSETIDGRLEEAFRLCSCNYRPQQRQKQRVCEGSERGEFAEEQLVESMLDEDG